MFSLENNPQMVISAIPAEQLRGEIKTVPQIEPPIDQQSCIPDILEFIFQQCSYGFFRVIMMSDFVLFLLCNMVIIVNIIYL